MVKEVKEIKLKDLTERSLLVNLEIDGQSGWRKDKLETLELELKTGAKSGRVTASKRILKEELAKIQTIDAKLRAFYQAWTRPWDKGYGIIPIATPAEEKAAANGEPVEINFVKFEKGLRALIDERNQVVKNHLDHYEEAIEKDKASLGSAWKASDYIPSAKLAKKYRVVYEVAPIPRSDFRVVGISKELLEDLQKRVAEKEKENFAAITTGIVQDCLELIKPIVDRLDDSDPGLSGPMLEKIKRIIDNLKRLDVTGDEELERMFDKLSDIVGKYDADILNVNSYARKSVKEELAGLMANMEGYL